MLVLKLLIFVGFLTVLNGCRTTSVLDSVTPEGFHLNGTAISFDNKRVLNTPERVAEHATFVFPSLRRIEEVPTQIVFGSNVENALITKRMLWGTTETVATVPIKNLLKSQFLYGISEHFHPLVGDQQPAIRIKVDVLCCIFKKCADKVESMVSMNIKIEDVLSNQICHEKMYVGKSVMTWNGGNLIPDSVFKSVQDCTSSFLKDISEDRTLIAKLEGLSPDVATVKKPSFIQFELAPKDLDGIMKGICQVKCNDWDEGRVATWIRAQLERRCENQLGIESSRIRVVYESSTFDAENRQWKVLFSAFPRSKMVLNYDSVTRSGTCVADLGLLGIDYEMASERLKDYVMAEMNKRAGVVSSANSKSNAQVRFDALKTDQRYNLIYCSFRLIY